MIACIWFYKYVECWMLNDDEIEWNQIAFRPFIKFLCTMHNMMFENDKLLSYVEACMWGASLQADELRI